jgi:anti-sigma B factor antagonist
VKVEVNISHLDEVTVVALNGDIDGSSAPVAQAQILPLAEPGCRILLDMSKVPYMSSAGLRMLLSTYRQLVSRDGHIVLVGLSEEIQDTMSVTGFLKFFTICATTEAGLTTLRAMT